MSRVFEIQMTVFVIKLRRKPPCQGGTFVNRQNQHVDSNSQSAKALVLLAGSSQLNGRLRLTCNSGSSPVTHRVGSNRMKANPQTLKTQFNEVC